MCVCSRGWMKPAHARAHRSGHRHNNSKGGRGRGVQRDGRARGQGPAGGGEGTVWQRGARGVCLRVPARSTRHGRGAPQQATCTSGFARVKGQWRGQAVGLVGALLAPLDRREDAKRCRRGRWRLPTHHRAMPRRRSSPPPPPPGGARWRRWRRRRRRRRRRWSLRQGAASAAATVAPRLVPPNSGLALRSWPADIGEGAHLWYSLKYGRASKGAAGRRAARRRTSRWST